MNAGLLESIERHPMSTLMVIAVLFLVREIFKIWRGKTDATTTEHESLKFARQTSETVNKCSSRSHDVMDMVERHYKKNDIGHIFTQLENTIQLLEKMDAVQSVHEVSLDRLDGVCHSIMDDLRRGDHRVVHSGIVNQIDKVRQTTDDIKQLSIHIAEKI